MNVTATALFGIFIGAVIANLVFWGLQGEWRRALDWILGNGAALTAVWIYIKWP